MVEKNMVTLTERTIMKSRSGVYSDTAENRRKHRVGQKYGAEKQSDDGEKTEKKETDPAKELEAVNKVIAAINEGKLNLPAAEVMKLSEKKQKLEAAKKQAEKINAGVKANEEKKNAEEAKETSKKINEAQKKEAEKKDKPVDELASAREELQRHKDKKDSWIAKYGKNSYETRLEQIKDNVERLKNKTRSEKEKKADEKNSKKAAEMKEKVKPEPKKERVSLSEKGKDEDDLREARKKLAYLQDNEERLIKRDGKEKYDKRVKQAKEEVQSLRTKVKGSDKYDEMTEKGTKANEDRQKRIDEKRKEGFLPIGGGQVAKVDEVTKDGDLKITMYNGDDEWKDIAKKGSQVFEELKDSYNSKGEQTESYTRIKFDDVPNSGKINLKKYLSEKVRKGVDEKWSNIKNIPTENLKKMEKGLVNDLNKNFEAIKKSQRAELLYSIMKVKGELESRGKENKGEQSSPKLYSGGKISGTKNEYSKNLNDVLNSENADSIVIPEHKLQGWHDTEDALAGTNWKVSREVDKNGNYELGGKYYIFHKKK